MNLEGVPTVIDWRQFDAQVEQRYPPRPTRRCHGEGTVCADRPRARLAHYEPTRRRPLMPFDVFLDARRRAEGASRHVKSSGGVW
jgi:hypothetical protein